MTRAPSLAISSAMPRPMPRPAPVTMPALPSRFIGVSPVWISYNVSPPSFASYWLAPFSKRREARQLATAFARLENNLHPLANLHLLRVHIDDVRHHRHPLVERDVGDDISGLGRAHDRVGVDLAGALRL